MFKKIGLFVFAVGLSAGAFATTKDYASCMEACDIALDNCTDSGTSWYSCRADLFACRSRCGA